MDAAKADQGAKLSYGIPDILLPRVGGGAINPCAFVGHELVLFFCPSDPRLAAEEIASYREHLHGFEDGGAWLMGILTGPEPEQAGDGIALASDADGAAWRAFESLLGETERSPEAAGGAFLFGRGGCLTRAWAGRGHAAAVLEALRRCD